MTKRQKAPAPLDPVTVASAAGAKSSGWLKLGDGRWTGTITDQQDEHYEVVEMPDGTWRAIDEDGEIVNGMTLEKTLKVALA